MKSLYINNCTLLKALTLSLLFSLWGQGGLAWGQSLLSWPTVRYTVKDGLSGMQCISVFKDSRGTVWIGTKAGLSRFNGEKFTNYGLKDGLLSEYVVVVGEDPQGYMWVNCGYGGLVRFDGQRFKQYAKISIPDNDFIAQMEQDGTILVRGVQYPHKIYQLKNDTLRLFNWAGVPKNIQRQVINVSLTKGEYLLNTATDLWLYKNKQMRLLAKGSV